MLLLLRRLAAREVRSEACFHSIVAVQGVVGGVCWLSAVSPLCAGRSPAVSDFPLRHSSPESVDAAVCAVHIIALPLLPAPVCARARPAPTRSAVQGATTDERAGKPAWMLAGDAGGVSQQRAVELQSPPPAPEANGAVEPQVLLMWLAQRD